MKFKKIFPIVICSALLAGGSLLAIQGVSRQAQKANAETDVGTVTVASVRNNAGDHFDINIYLVLNETTALPDSWDYAYTAVGEDSGVFINGEKQNGAIVKHANGNDIQYGLPRALNENEVVEFKGTFATESGGGYRFSIDYATQRFGGDWILPLEDYDVVSLADANLPDFASGAAINTDDMGEDYTYTTDRYALPTRKGFFGLTNDTGSYAFQMGYQKTATGTGWFHVLIGGMGPLWNSGHFIDYGFLDSWADTGHALIKEMKGKGNNWEADSLQDSDAIPLGWTVGERNILEMGLIKVKDSSEHLVFFKVNGALKYSGYWTLDDGQMSTKVTFQYGGTDAAVTNTVEPTSVKLHTNGAMTGLYIDNDVCPAIHNWDDFFMSVSKDGLKLNGVAFGNDKWNYFKKTSATGLYLDLAGAGAGSTFEAGDTIYIGGMFKAARIINDVRVLFKIVIADSYFEYTGTEWREIDVNYTAVDFAKDLLKQTLTICTGEGGNNKDALTTVWGTLSGANYYGKLSSSEMADLASESGDSTIVVPTTAAEVDAMSDGDALAAGLYRYDYCTLKYSLTNFIDGRTPSLASSEMRVINTTTNVNVVLLITISAIVVGASLFVVLHFVSRKRKQDR